VIPGYFFAFLQEMIGQKKWGGRLDKIISNLRR